MKVYPEVLMQHTADTTLSREARGYLEEHLDPENDDALRHVIHHLYLPEFNTYSDTTKDHYKRALQWMINCADGAWLGEVADWDPDTVVPAPSNPRRLFTAWWQALFGDEPSESPDLCAACDPVPIDSGTLDGIYEGHGHYVVAPEVLNFPRSDGHPPGHEAPPNVYREGFVGLPRRPTDGARFFRWEDQAKAIKRATKIHKKGRQQKVWVEFEFPIGEGYQTGGDDAVWETNYACVRFYEGKPVDSWPDLRKGWRR